MYQQNIPMTKVPIKAESATDGPSVVFLRHVRQCRFRDVLFYYDAGERPRYAVTNGRPILV